MRLSWWERQFINTTWIYKIYTFSGNFMYRRIKRPYQKIIRIIKFIPKIWRFEVWDHYHLFILLSAVVREYRTGFDAPDKVMIVESSRKRIYKDLTITLNIFRRLAYEEYDKNPFLDWTKDADRLNISIREMFSKGLPKVVDRKIDLKTKLNMEDKLRKHDIDLLCKTLKKSDRWWD